MRLPLLFAAALSLGACAGTGHSPLVEQGFKTGSLAVAAIDRGDWEKAEKLLMTSKELRSDDPALLINLGKVYLETGRTELALATWRSALASDRHFMVATIDGRWLSTEALARQALAQNEQRLRTAMR